MHTANDLTRIILLEFPKRYPGSRLFRRNVGAGLPQSAVANAKRYLAAGNYKAAMAALSSRLVFFGMAGEPDLCGWHSPSGRRVGIEVKIGEDEQSDAQIVMEGAMTRGGAIYVVARTPDRLWVDLAAALAR